MDTQLYEFLMAGLRFVAFAILTVYAVRNKDWLAMAIAVLWTAAIFTGVVLEARFITQIIASPLACLVVWALMTRKK